MRLKLVPALVALGFVALTFSALPTVSAAADVPIWTVGDSWTYVGYGFSIPLAPRGTYTFNVTGTDTIVENGTTISAFHVEVWTNATNMSPWHAADEWYRMSDLAFVRLSLNYSECFIGFPPSYGCANRTVSSTATPPLPSHFPLTAGDNSSTAVVVTREVLNRDNGSASWSNYTGWANDSVGADEQIVVPAGNFTSTPFRQNYSLAATGFTLSFSGYTVRDFSAIVGNAVRERDFLPTNPHTGLPGPVLWASMALTAYSYSPPWYDLKVLGIPVWTWLVLAGAVVLVAAVFLLHRWRHKGAPASPAQAPQAPPAPVTPPKGPP